MNLLEKIDYLIKENDLNKRKLSINANIPYSTVDGFYKQGFENIRLTTFRKLCDYFGVTMDSMAHDEKDIEYTSDEAPAALKPSERNLLNIYNELDPRGQSAVDDTLRREHEYIENEREQALEHGLSTSSEEKDTEKPDALSA